jgi:hypothetical protein
LRQIRDFNVKLKRERRRRFPERRRCSFSSFSLPPVSWKQNFAGPLEREKKLKISKKGKGSEINKKN